MGGQHSTANPISAFGAKMDNITCEERKGIEMIQALLKFAGQSEPEHISLINWRGMDEGEKAQTKWAYKTFIKE